MSVWKKGAILVVSFLFAFACCLPFSENENDRENSDEGERSRVIGSGTKVSFSESFDTWTGGGKQSREEFLRMAELAGEMSDKERERILTKILAMSEEERREVLSVILLRWLESDPVGTVVWCQSELKGQERSDIIFELTTTWAYQDAIGLAHWWAENTPEKDIHRLGEKSVGNILAKVDPMVYAEYMEMARLHRIQEIGGIKEETIPGPDELPNYAEALLGKVAYVQDKPELLTRLSSARHMPGKSGWNHLFERVAVHWYRSDPKKVDAWLEKFPEEAQISARHWIKDDRR